MKIRKTYQGVVPSGKVLNSKSDSQIDTYSCDYLNNIIGKIQILGIQTVILAASNIASGGTSQSSANFTQVDGADDYIVIQQNNNWLVPTAINVTGTTLSATLLNPFTSTKTGNCSFIIMAYKNLA